MTFFTCEISIKQAHTQNRLAVVRGGRKRKRQGRKRREERGKETRGTQYNGVYFRLVEYMSSLCVLGWRGRDDLYLFYLRRY